MEPKSFNEEDVSDLKSLGFNDDQIKKLSNLTIKDLRKLLPPKYSKSTPRARIKKGEYYITYTTSCNLCGAQLVHHSESICRKEWKTMHSFYQTGKGVCKVNSCSACRKYLEGLPQSKLIDIILKKREDMDMPTPEILDEEDEEHTFYPLMVVNISGVHTMNITKGVEE